MTTREAVPFIPLFVDAYNHPKIVDAARRCGIGYPKMMGHLTLLWSWVRQHRPDGICQSCEEVEAAAQWDGEAAGLVYPLVKARLIDDNERGLSIHDWPYAKRSSPQPVSVQPVQSVPSAPAIPADTVVVNQVGGYAQTIGPEGMAAIERAFASRLSELDRIWLDETLIRAEREAGTRSKAALKRAFGQIGNAMDRLSATGRFAVGEHGISNPRPYIAKLVIDEIRRQRDEYTQPTIMPPPTPIRSYAG